MAESTATLRGVTRRYGQQAAVEDVSFALTPGQTVALVGHNGAGKTTLMKLMLGLIRPTAGEITVLGQNPASSFGAARDRVPARERRLQPIARGPQAPAVLRQPQERPARRRPAL